jgi:DNA-binding MarR family transcriptional regulator
MVELSRLMVGIAYRSLEGLDSGLDLPAFRALAYIDRHPGSTMGALALGVVLPPSTTTRLCDRLAAAGWVSRRHNPENRRQVEVTLTRKGRKLVGTAVAARGRELQAVLDRLPTGQREALLGLLPDLIEAAASRLANDVPAWSV